MRYCFDLDNTICKTVDGDYEKSVPIVLMIDKVNRLYAQGDTIIFHTARGTISGLDWRELTERQLKDWGVNYHELYFGKPYADVYIDDKAVPPGRVAAIIQARMGSTRLPGKVMLDICGKPLLAHVVDSVSSVVDVIVATTGSSPEVIEFCSNNNIPCYVGSEMDVLDRYYQAAKAYNLDVVIRVTSDNPLIDPEMIRDLVKFYEQGDYDWAANCRLKTTYQIGNDAEIFSFKTLEKAWDLADDPYDREHVTPFIYQHPEMFKLGVLENDIDLSHIRWTVDTEEDLGRVKGIYEGLRVSSGIHA